MSAAQKSAAAIEPPEANEIDSPEAKQPRNRQRERSEMSTSRLLAAAAELFADRGYRQTSLADIGKHAGYSHGLVTRRFGSKQGLVVTLLDHMIDAWMQSTLLPNLANRADVTGIRAFFDAFCANATAHRSNLRALEALMFEGLWAEPEVKERLTAVQKHGHDRLRELVQGDLKAANVKGDADAIALMAGTALRGATYRWLLEDDFDLCATMTAFGDVLEALVRPRA